MDALYIPLQVNSPVPTPPNCLKLSADVQGRLWAQMPNSAPVQINSVAVEGVTSVNDETGAVVLLPPDTGWLAPQSAGAKDTSLQDYANPGDFAGADTVDLTLISAIGGQLEDLTDKLQALETALAANLRPNA